MSRDGAASGEVLLDLSRQQRNLLLFRLLVQLELGKNMFGACAEGYRLFDGIDRCYLVLAILAFIRVSCPVAQLLGESGTEPEQGKNYVELLPTHLVHGATKPVHG